MRVHVRVGGSFMATTAEIARPMLLIAGGIGAFAVQLPEEKSYEFGILNRGAPHPQASRRCTRSWRTR
jgi:hypothetical protein